jgi:Peptidase family M1 domain
MTVVICTFALLLAGTALAQDEGAFHNAMPVASPPGPLPEPFRIGSPRNQTPVGNTPSEAAALYRRLRDIHLDPQKVYRVREASIEREDVHITLDDGMIAFTQTVDGRITGAFFEGEGEVLLIPPDRVERRSLGLFTNSAVLEEKFTSAFLRFNDNLAEELSYYLREHEEDPQTFVTKWDNTANSLSETDALRLLTSFLNGSSGSDGKVTPPEGDRMLRARINGTKLGVFDLFFDTDAREQISVGQLARDQYGRSFFNVWTTFPMRSMRLRGTTRRSTRTAKAVTPAALGSTTDEEPEDRLRIADYKIKVAVKPPTDLDVECIMNAEVRNGGQRVILLELSRFLKVSTIETDGKPLEFLQNEALEGTALARRGNDLVALIFPQKLQTGQKLQIRFVYGGSVMMDAGGGLVYVGARGIWYPNRGVSMANFNMEFTYPDEWTLVATGKRSTTKSSQGIVTSNWVTERPIPLAGFNLGHYVKAEAKLGTIPIEVYASRGVETNMAIANKAIVFSTAKHPGDVGDGQMVALAPPTPALNAQRVADRVQKGLESLSRQLGPYPFDSLVLSQMPGRISQGWPGLIFLSSYVFLTPEEMERSKIGGVDSIMYTTLVPIHEAAHQWWGDMVSWKGYRDQWLVEALANYCALVAMEKSQPKEVQQVLDLYRRQLLQVNNETKLLGADAGPVTLGVRLYSSQFPAGYEQISYGRGTWLFHMLRHMLRDAEQKDARTDSAAANRMATGDEPFFRVLRKICERYQGRFVNNHIVQQAFEEELPESLRFDGRKSLDWFFDEWVNGTAIPRLETTNVKITAAGKGSVVSGKILQKESPPELVSSIPVYGVSGKGPVLLGRVFADGAETAFRLSAPAGIRKIELDPYDTVLRRKD